MKLKKFWLALHISPLSGAVCFSGRASLPLPLIPLVLVRSWQRSVKGNDLKPIIGFRCTHSFFPLCDKIISAACYTCFTAVEHLTHFLCLLCAVQQTAKGEAISNTLIFYRIISHFGPLRLLAQLFWRTFSVG